jgi:hypothetical protein
LYGTTETLVKLLKFNGSDVARDVAGRSQEELVTTELRPGLGSVRKREPNALASGNRAKNGLVHVFSDRASFESEFTTQKALLLS